MDVDKILNIDSRIESQKQSLQKHLKEIKPFRKFKGGNKKVPQAYLEKFIKIASNKYNVYISYIHCDTRSNSRYLIWHIVMRSKEDNATYKSIYGLSMYEALAKVCIYLHSKTKEYLS